MPNQLSIHAVHNGDMRITATARNHSVVMDYPLKATETAGMTPLETLLASLAACGGNTMALLLRRSQQPFSGLEVAVSGSRREEHPTVITDITMEFRVRGQGLDPLAVQRALKESEEHLCPVWAMLKSGTKISASARIVESFLERHHDNSSQ